MTSYDSTFFDYVNASALRSARRLLPVLRQHLCIESVVDVGCGQGAWSSFSHEITMDTVRRIDRHGVDSSRQLIGAARRTTHRTVTDDVLAGRFALVRPADKGDDSNKPERRRRPMHPTNAAQSGSALPSPGQLRKRTIGSLPPAVITKPAKSEERAPVHRLVPAE